MAAKQSPYWRISLEIPSRQLDLSNAVFRVDIVGNITTPYHNLKLSLRMDSKNWITDDLYGQDDLVLTVMRMTEDEKPTTVIAVALSIIKIEFPLSLKTEKDKQNPLEDSITLYCVLQMPFTLMNSTINKLFSDKKPMNPIEAVKELGKIFLPGEPDLKLDISTKNQNEEKITQIIIPPMTWMHSIRYLDQYFGLYNGPMHHFLQFDIEDQPMTYYMWDMSNRITEQPAYTLYILSRDGDHGDVMKEAGLKDDVFYTTDVVRTTFMANTDVLLNGYDQVFTAKPIDKLYERIPFKMDEIYEKYTPTDGEKDFKINPSSKFRTEYRSKNETGYEKTKASFTSQLSRRLSIGSEIEFSLHRSMLLKNIIKVGVPILIKPRVLQYMDYQGKYIVSAIELMFSKEPEGGQGEYWTSKINVKAFRANVKYMKKQDQ